MSPDNLISGASNIMLVKEILLSETLVATLNTIGGVHLEAASKALKSAKKEANNKIQIQEAMGHLRVSHIAFQKAWKKRDNYFSKNTELSVLMDLIYNDIGVCLLRSMCAASLNLKSDVKSGISDAKIAFDYLESIEDSRDFFRTILGFSMFFNPRELKSFVNSFKDDNDLPYFSDRTDYDKFERELINGTEKYF